MVALMNIATPSCWRMIGQHVQEIIQGFKTAFLIVDHSLSSISFAFVMASFGSSFRDIREVLCDVSRSVAILYGLFACLFFVATLARCCTHIILDMLLGRYPARKDTQCWDVRCQLPHNGPHILNFLKNICSQLFKKPVNFYIFLYKQNLAIWLNKYATWPLELL